MMKTLKSFVVAFSLVLVPSLSEAGLLDMVVFPILRRTTTTGGRVGGGMFRGGGYNNNIFRHTSPYIQFVQGYATYNGGDNDEGDIFDEEILVPGQQPPGESFDVNPYCPHQANWPQQVVAGSLHNPFGGTVMSDMLTDLYRTDQYEEEEEDEEEEEGELVVELHQRVDLVESRMNDPWVERYLRGDIVIGTPPGMMGEQVLDLARAALDRLDSLDEVTHLGFTADIIYTLPVDELDRLAEVIRLNRWDLASIRSNILSVIDRHTNLMTGTINMEVLDEPFVGMTIFHRLHDELWGGSDTADMLTYKSAIEDGLRALEDHMDSRLQDN